MKPLLKLVLVAVYITWLGCSDKKEAAGPQTQTDLISGDYLCHDSLYDHYHTTNDTTGVWITTQYDSTYVIHVDFQKDSNNLVSFPGFRASLNTEGIYDYSMQSAGGSVAEHARFANDSLYYLNESSSVNLMHTHHQQIIGKRIH